MLALLLLLALPAVAQTVKPPLLVLLGAGAAWQDGCRERGWQSIEPWSETAGKSMDDRVAALAAQVAEATKRFGADDARVYLIGQGDQASAVFYIASRIPSVWAAAVAAGGSPRPAMDGNRLFGANTTNLPVLWLAADKGSDALGRKLSAAGFNLDSRIEPEAKPSDVFDWLAAHRRETYPTTADCETGSKLFPHCYWVEMTGFDPAERNDVLDSTRVPPVGSGASLAIGPFGFHTGAPGPGVLVAWLPDKYGGPLKLGDRIVELGGKQLRDGAHYAELMDQMTEEKPVVVMVVRGKQRLRQETKFVFPPRAELVTARVRARYLTDLHEVEVISRALTQMKLKLPAAWLPAKISWNGTDVAKAEEAGCWLLEEQKELLSARRCE